MRVISIKGHAGELEVGDSFSRQLLPALSISQHDVKTFIRGSEDHPVWGDGHAMDTKRIDVLYECSAWLWLCLIGVCVLRLSGFHSLVVEWIILIRSRRGRFLRGFEAWLWQAVFDEHVVVRLTSFGW